MSQPKGVGNRLIRRGQHPPHQFRQSSSVNAEGDQYRRHHQNPKDRNGDKIGQRRCQGDFSEYKQQERGHPGQENQLEFPDRQGVPDCGAYELACVADRSAQTLYPPATFLRDETVDEPDRTERKPKTR